MYKIIDVSSNQQEDSMNSLLTLLFVLNINTARYAYAEVVEEQDVLQICICCLKDESKCRCVQDEDEYRARKEEGYYDT